MPGVARDERALGLHHATLRVGEAEAFQALRDRLRSAGVLVREDARAVLARDPAGNLLEIEA